MNCQAQASGVLGSGAAFRRPHHRQPGRPITARPRGTQLAHRGSGQLTGAVIRVRRTRRGHTVNGMFDCVGANRIRGLRERAAMTQAQLAEATGIAQPHLSAYENAARPVTPRVLARIEEATRVRPSELVRRHREEIRALARKYGGENPRVFGSVAHGTDTFDSDIDLVVRFRPDASLGDVALLQGELLEVLGVPVEVISEGGLRGRFGHRVLADAQPV
jgi:uncharacterized protein